MKIIFWGILVIAGFLFLSSCFHNILRKKNNLSFSLCGTVYLDTNQSSSKEAIEGVVIILCGSDGTVASDTTDAFGKYEFDKKKISPNTSYVFQTKENGYFSFKSRISTVGINESINFINDFYLVHLDTGPVFPNIEFDYGTWEIKPESEEILYSFVKTLTENPMLVIKVEAYTDEPGTLEYNDTLSYNRAKSVTDYLIMKGIDPDRLVPHAYGKRLPRTLVKDVAIDGYTFPKGIQLTEEYISQFSSDKNKMEAAHKLNNRINFSVLRSDFMPTEKK